jgi:hypothetical protein
MGVRMRPSKPDGWGCESTRAAWAHRSVLAAIVTFWNPALYPPGQSNGAAVDPRAYGSPERDSPLAPAADTSAGWVRLPVQLLAIV